MSTTQTEQTAAPSPLDRLRHHVSGAIARGEAQAIAAHNAGTQAARTQADNLLTLGLSQDEAAARLDAQNARTAYTKARQARRDICAAALLALGTAHARKASKWFTEATHHTDSNAATFYTRARDSWLRALDVVTQEQDAAREVRAAAYGYTMPATHDEARAALTLAPYMQERLAGRRGSYCRIGCASCDIRQIFAVGVTPQTAALNAIRMGWRANAQGASCAAHRDVWEHFNASQDATAAPLFPRELIASCYDQDASAQAREDEEQAGYDYQNEQQSEREQAAQLTAIEHALSIDDHGNTVATCGGCGEEYTIMDSMPGEATAAEVYNAEWRYCLIGDTEALYCDACVDRYERGADTPAGQASAASFADTLGASVHINGPALVAAKDAQARHIENAHTAVIAARTEPSLKGIVCDLLTTYGADAIRLELNGLARPDAIQCGPSCNGWANYETWLMFTWLEDNAGREIWNIAAELHTAHPEPNHPQDKTSYLTADIYTADAIKAYAEEHGSSYDSDGYNADGYHYSDAGASDGLAHQMFNAALTRVDWREIARHYRPENAADNAPQD